MIPIFSNINHRRDISLHLNSTLIPIKKKKVSYVIGAHKNKAILVRIAFFWEFWGNFRHLVLKYGFRKKRANLSVGITNLLFFNLYVMYNLGLKGFQSRSSFSTSNLPWEVSTMLIIISVNDGRWIWLFIIFIHFILKSLLDDVYWNKLGHPVVFNCEGVV